MLFSGCSFVRSSSFSKRILYSFVLSVIANEMLIAISLLISMSLRIHDSASACVGFIGPRNVRVECFGSFVVVVVMQRTVIPFGLLLRDSAAFL